MAGTSLQRVLLLTIMVNLIIGITGDLYFNNIANADRTMDSSGSILDEYNYNYEKTFGEATPDTQNVYLQKDFGDLKYGGMHWWSILSSAVMPIPNNELEGTAEHRLIRNINYFRGVLVLLAGFEAFLIFYGKKVT